MKKILLISHPFLPALGPRTIQLGKIANQIWKYEDWDVFVFSSIYKKFQMPMDYELEKYYIRNNSNKVYRTKEYYIANNKITTNFLMIPDDRIWWSLFSRKKLKQIVQKEQFDVILSSAYPFSNHLLAYWLKKKTGLPWAAYFSDPWTTSPFRQAFNPIRKLIEMHMEQKIIINSNALIFPSKQTKNSVLSKYSNRYYQKAKILPHCYDPNLLHSYTKNQNNNKCYKFLYSGNFYGSRNPESIFLSLSKLRQELPAAYKKVELIFHGDNSHVQMKYRNLLSVHKDKIKFIPHSDYINSLNLMMQADVLLLIDAPNKIESPFFPSKLADYIGTKKPILGITTKKGPSGDILRELGMQISEPKDIDLICHSIKELVEKLDSHSEVVNNSSIERYSVKTVARELVKILSELVK